MLQSHSVGRFYSIQSCYLNVERWNFEKIIRYVQHKLVFKNLSWSTLQRYYNCYLRHHHFVSDICLTACLPSCNLLALPLFICSSVFPLNSRASFFRDLVFRVTLQRGTRGNGWTHQTHSSSLLSYLAGGRWWYPFPPSNVFALHPMPSVNMQLLHSHFSFEARGQVE